METIYLCIIIFLFVLAVFDLMVGVSNDAVNFLNSAVGAKAASFKTILFIAGAGIFIGASLSNGMMDIARHGIYQPEHFYFAEIMCILLAVMLTDVVLLDVFYGNAYLDHCFNGIRTFGRYFCPSTYQSTQQ
jgi:phosphate/sulfate permease